eukprot:Hpha_TRINITY_DN12970_c0_g1::TRINITY_DN12970_c0_g1_i1::g.164305::m.164305
MAAKGKAVAKGKGEKKLDFGPPVDPAKPLFPTSCDPQRDPDRWAAEYKEHEARVLQPAFEGGTCVFDLRALRQVRDDMADRKRGRQMVMRPVSAPLPAGAALRSPDPASVSSLMVTSQVRGSPLMRTFSGQTTVGSNFEEDPMRRRVPLPASLRAPTLSPRPLRSASPGMSPERAVATLPAATGSPRQLQSPKPAVTDAEVLALFTCCSPGAEGVGVQLDCRGVNLGWCFELDGELPSLPATLSTLYSQRDERRPAPLNSPRSVLVSFRQGVSPADLRMPVAADFNQVDVPPSLQKRRLEHAIQRRDVLLETLLQDYRSVIDELPMVRVLELAAAFVRGGHCGPSRPTTALDGSVRGSPRRKAAKRTDESVTDEAGRASPADESLFSAADDAAVPTFYRARKERSEKAQRVRRERLRRQLENRAALDQAEFEAAAKRLEEEEAREKDMKRQEQERIAKQCKALQERQERLDENERMRVAREEARFQMRKALEERDYERTQQLQQKKDSERCEMQRRQSERRGHWRRAVQRGEELEAARVAKVLERTMEKERQLENWKRGQEHRRVLGLEPIQRKEQHRKEVVAAANRLAEDKREVLHKRFNAQSAAYEGRAEEKVRTRIDRRCGEELAHDDKRYYVQRQARAQCFSRAVMLSQFEKKKERMRNADHLRRELDEDVKRATEQERQAKEQNAEELRKRALTNKLGRASPVAK